VASSADFLNRMYSQYHHREFLTLDPLEFVHDYQDPWDQEVVALVAALLAYGNVRQIRRSVKDLLARMSAKHAGPADFVRSLGSPRAFDGFVHRFNTGDDLFLLMRLLNQSWSRWGSLGGHFISFLSPEDETIEGALNGLMQDWKSQAQDLTSGRVREGFLYLLNAPADGSCCKRWCMLLRWMGRKDEIDPGLWTQASALNVTFPTGRAVSPAQLVLPLDTHTGRISKKLRLTQRKSLNWKAAVEITRRLKRYDPSDPTKYDFSLCRAGMKNERV
jgi:uncharacterized protein (TIGR02757 family)